VKKPVYGHESNYEIDNEGNIWSLRREKTINKRKYVWSSKKLKPIVDRNGYLYVNLCNGKSAKKMAIHRLVLLSFVGEPKKGMICCHLDGNKLNNNINNLRWATHADNYADSIKHKTNAIGIRNGKSKLNEDQVKEIIFSNEPSLSICKKYNVAASTIRAVRLKQNWKHIHC
jgi:hypothetical protein